MEIVLLHSAQADLLEVIAKRGEKFYDIIDDALEVIRTHPESAPIYWKDVRRKVVPGTTYGIFYRVHGERIFTSYVLDLRQDPEVIGDRLKS